LSKRNTAYLAAGKEVKMKKSNNRKGRDVTAALYVRLSRDDNIDGESNSIVNQKKLLTKVAADKGYTNLLTFSDDGISGVTMKRPGYQQMLEAIENGIVSAIIVKDMSRLGRNYIEVGRLTDEFLPEYNVRLISVSDGVDSEEGENEFAPFINIMSEWYARDISKKRRASYKVKGASGEPLGMPPYGYMRDPDRPKFWKPDEEAAFVVRRIFNMSLDGYGSEQIASVLERDKVLTPMNYWNSKGVRKQGRQQKSGACVYNWCSQTVAQILSRQEYCGDVLNFKTFTKSFKQKARLENDRENWSIHENVHEPIISRAVWEKVQVKRTNIRRRKANSGERNMFSGIVFCADCGSIMHYRFNHRNNEIKYFSCSDYVGNKRGGTCQTTHYIRLDFLEQVVLGEIRRIMRFATRYEDEFARLVMDHSRKVMESEIETKRNELNSLKRRDSEIDRLFNTMYEDNVAGKIDDSRFAKMSSQYSDEQSAIAVRVKEIKTELERNTQKSGTTKTFLSIVRRYTRTKKLTPFMLNELIEKIEVYQAEKGQGEHSQKLRIHFNCIGSIEIPEIPQLAEPEIQIRTRKGVSINYAGLAANT